jgi:hypothetical protein
MGELKIKEQESKQQNRHAAAMTSAILLFASCILISVVPDAGAGSESLTDAVTWLEGESHRLIRAGGRTMKDGTTAFPPQVGIGYEAFWLRDFAYTLEGSVDSAPAWTV